MLDLLKDIYHAVFRVEVFILGSMLIVLGTILYLGAQDAKESVALEQQRQELISECLKQEMILVSHEDSRFCVEIKNLHAL